VGAEAAGGASVFLVVERVLATAAAVAVGSLMFETEGGGSLSFDLNKSAYH